MIYYTIQKGYEIFGTGSTAEESLADAKEWIDKDSQIQDFNVEDLQSYNQANDGEFCIVTKEEYENREDEDRNRRINCLLGDKAWLRSKRYMAEIKKIRK